MTDDMITLGKRATACKGWRWMPGMLAVEWAAPGMGLTGGRPGRVDERWHEVGVWLPDLTDPATVGCLLALVREAYGDPSAYVRLSDTTRQSDGVRAWEVLGWLNPMRSPDGCGGSWRGWGYASEAEALVAALEAAP